MVLYRKYIGIVIFLCCGVTTLSAQNDMVSSLSRQNVGEGTVTLHQDSRLTSLLGKPFVAQNATDGVDKQMMKVAGFRVQVYAGNNSRAARNEANDVADKVKELFPDLEVYTHFINPRWLCRVGDFRSIEEADAVMRKLKETDMFKEVSIVRGQINIPY